ncbi:MAG: peptide chain release factor N(5)-glutamine methyltransferase [Thiotrichales bacterium]
MTLTLGTAVRNATLLLSAHTEAARLEAEVLLAHVLQRPRGYLYAWPEHALGKREQSAYDTLLKRRIAGEPIAYLVGQREFWSLTLAVSPAVLIPRPDTELLVELALGRLPAGDCAEVADLGTGSGAIALALAHTAPRWRITATDRCEQALKIAEFNAKRLGLGNVTFHCGDWCAALPGNRYDLILSNPPYLAVDDPHLRHAGLPFEPRAALVAGEDGLDALRRICACARAHLNPGGWLILEHGYTQAPAVRELLTTHAYTGIESHRDWAGQPRATIGRRSPEAATEAA